MTETDTAPSRPRRRWFSVVLLILLVLAALAGLGYAGWYLERERAAAQETADSQDALLRRLGRQQSLEQSQLNELGGRVADLSQSSNDHSDELAKLQSRFDETQAALDRVQEAVQGGRRRLQLMAVEQLLLIAGDRAQLADDVHSAVAAMSLAQERLGAIADPRLFEIRKAVADERAALAAVSAPDIAGASLTLGSLIGRIAKLPLKTDLPDRYQPDRLPADDAPFDHSWTTRLWTTVKSALSDLFTVRRAQGPQVRMMAIEQQSLTGAVLALKLENARAALLAGQTEAYHGALTEAADWLKTYYRDQDPGVLAAQADIEKLESLDPHPQLPELGRALGLLRAYLDALPQ